MPHVEKGVHGQTVASMMHAFLLQQSDQLAAAAPAVRLIQELQSEVSGLRIECKNAKRGLAQCEASLHVALAENMGLRAVTVESDAQVKVLPA